MVECSSAENSGIAIKLAVNGCKRLSSKRKAHIAQRQESQRSWEVWWVRVPPMRPKGHEYGMTVFSNLEYWVRFPTCPQIREEVKWMNLIGTFIV